MHQSAEFRDHDLYMRVRAARRKRGIAEKYCSSDPVAHPIVGKQLRHKESGRVYNVEKAVRHWRWGWYFAILLERNGSHGLRFWEDISCGDPLVVDLIRQTRSEYEVVETADGSAGCAA